MVQVAENLDVGNTSRPKIHPCRPAGKISLALRAGGSSSSLSELPNYRMRTPRPCCCWMESASDAGDWDQGREGDTGQWCGVLGINCAMNSALLRQKCSLGAPYSLRRLRFGAPKLNSTWEWIFYVQHLKGNGQNLVVMDIRMPQLHEIG